MQLTFIWNYLLSIVFDAACPPYNFQAFLSSPYLSPITTLAPFLLILASSNLQLCSPEFIFAHKRLVAEFRCPAELSTLLGSDCTQCHCHLISSLFLHILLLKPYIHPVNYRTTQYDQTSRLSTQGLRSGTTWHNKRCWRPTIYTPGWKMEPFFLLKGRQIS